MKSFLSKTTLIIFSIFALILSLTLIFTWDPVNYVEKKEKKTLNQQIKKKSVPKKNYTPKPINQLTIEELWSYYENNPCYLPLIKDSTIWEKGKQAGFEYEDLINKLLFEDNKYRNRYLVGDFNVIDQNGNSRGIEEKYPVLKDLIDFQNLPKDLVMKMDSIKYGTAEYKNLTDEMKNSLNDSAEIYINFLEKVWRYRMLPIKRQYSINNENLFAAGQTIVMCEACKDTLKMLGKFAISAKRQDYGSYIDKDGKKHRYLIEYLPTGRGRKYYAGRNRITSKNWETKRKYEELDLKHDKEMGGGNSRVTFYEGKVQLPNFLLIEPYPEYEGAMHQNGIHEVALRSLARGMLGTGNSIGCIRVTDFGSKFLRWWTPQNCNFFISYHEKRYHKKIDYEGSIINYLPFKSLSEGQSFRNWINKERKEDAKRLEISDSGDYKNGFILDAYYALEKEYKAYLKNNNKK